MRFADHVASASPIGPEKWLRRTVAGFHLLAVGSMLALLVMGWLAVSDGLPLSEWLHAQPAAIVLLVLSPGLQFASAHLLARRRRAGFWLALFVLLGCPIAVWGAGDGQVGLVRLALLVLLVLGRGAVFDSEASSTSRRARPSAAG